MQSLIQFDVDRDITCITFWADDDETPELVSSSKSSGRSSLSALRSALGTEKESNWTQRNVPEVGDNLCNLLFIEQQTAGLTITQKFNENVMLLVGPDPHWGNWVVI